MVEITYVSETLGEIKINYSEFLLSVDITDNIPKFEDKQ